MIHQSNTANVRKKLNLGIHKIFSGKSEVYLLQSLKQECPPRALLLLVPGQRLFCEVPYAVVLELCGLVGLLKLFYIAKATLWAVRRWEQQLKVTSKLPCIYTIHVLPGFEPGPHNERPAMPV